MGLQHFSQFSLKTCNSFGFDEPAREFWRVQERRDLPALLSALRATPLAQGMSATLPLLLGGGSNLLITGPVARPVVQFAFRKASILRLDKQHAWVEAEAGMPWHEFVLWTLEQGLSGLENLSLIPGTVGAAPIQNIGAYGVELKDSFDSLQALDISAALSNAQVCSGNPLPFLELNGRECAFGYRDSVFKKRPELWITAARFKLPLAKCANLKLDYGELKTWLQAQGRTQISPRDVSDAVIAIRSSKLPDPKVLGNAGSFFKNPVLPLEQANQLVALHPGIPNYPADSAGQRKVSAAWLIEQCGLKGFREGDAGVHKAHALVLVNYGSARGSDMLKLARHIQAIVLKRFGVALEPEPSIIQA